MSKKVILDTDIGVDIDDSMCLSYLLSNPDIELMGITTVSGQSEKRCQMADVICHHFGREDVPVFPGIETSLTGALQSDAWQAVKVKNWKHREGFPKGQAIQFMIDTIRKHPGEITLLAIGPLGNIALLFDMDPEIPELLKELVIMGGWFKQEYNENVKPEWNIKCDPLAAQIVFSRGRNIRCVGLDVTNILRLSIVEAQEKLNTYKVLHPSRDFAEVWFEKAQWMYFHDPLAAAVVADASLCEFEQGSVEVDLTPGARFGWTTFTPGGGNVAIGTKVSPEGFFEHYFNVISEADASIF